MEWSGRAPAPPAMEAIQGANVEEFVATQRIEHNIRAGAFRNASIDGGEMTLWVNRVDLGAVAGCRL
jgi:hypothetical protein